MRILVLGNCPSFTHSVFFHLTNNPSFTSTAHSSIRFGEHRVIEFEIVLGMRMEGSISGHVWGLEAIQADGIIYIIDPNDPDNKCETFISTYTISLLPSLSLPSVLLLPPATNNSDNLTELLRTGRCLEVDKWSGQNCHLALLSLIYLIVINR